MDTLLDSMATEKALDGKPAAGNPHIRFDEGEVAPAATPRRGSLLYKNKATIALATALSLAVAMGYATTEVPVASNIQIGTVNERIAYIGADKDCSFGELFQVEKPFSITDDTAIIVTVRSRAACHASLFWHLEGCGRNETAGNGVGFEIEGGETWRTYVLRPNSVPHGRIARVRFYPYAAQEDATAVTLKSIVFERRGFASFPAADADGIVFRMKSDAFEYLSLNWRATEGEKPSVPFFMGFTSIPDGREHMYWFDLKNTKDRMTFGGPHWFGRIVGFCLRAGLKNREFMPDGISFVKGKPRIPADPVVRQVFPEDAIPRAGRPLPIEIVVRNYGTEPAEGIKFALENLPEGMRVLNDADLSPSGAIAPSAGYDYIRDDYMTNGLPNERRFRITLSDPGRPMSFMPRLVLTAANGVRSEKDFHVKVLPSLNLAPCDYPPEPKPLDMGGVEVGVFLFPGWKRHQWYPAWDAMPERKPVLGWYDDTLPEVRDWQIKWLVENGISYAFVDWYWASEKGPSPYNYWLEGIAKARYRKYLKYAALWCNENTYRHSEKDQRMVTQHWIDNFFADPQYLKIDGKPVVGMWAHNMEKNMGPGAAKKLIGISQEMARAAGYPGIYFVSIYGYGSEKPQQQQALKDYGVDAGFEYCYKTTGTPHATGMPNGSIGYSVVAGSSLRHWRTIHELGILPFFPSLSTGWGNLPWRGDRGWEIVGMTPSKFAKVCRDAKRFSEETGVKRLLLGPLDEWCEGEIGYPNAEHGFGMLEAVRETFARKPPEGFPLNYAPQDVGLGPYTKENSVIK